MNQAKPFFSIVIPTFNEEKNVGNILNDLSIQTSLSFEVIIVDGNSTDKTGQVVNGNKSIRRMLKFVSTSDRGAAIQRNLGATMATGQYIIFMDADNRLPNDFLEKVKNNLEVSKSDVFTCYIDDNLNSYKERLTASFINVYINFMYTVSSPGAIGALIGCKKEIFTEKTKFKQQLVPFEDGAFVRNLHHLKYKCDIYKYPKFKYSLRRFEKYGYGNTFVHYFKLQIINKILRKQILQTEYKMGG